MNYNQILGKINEETRKKVADEYNEIHKKYIVPEDYSGSVNLIDRLLKNKNIKIFYLYKTIGYLCNKLKNLIIN